MAPAAIDLDGVIVRHGALVALGPVTLRVARGERVAVVGPSGAGKTTLLRVAGTALPPSAGRVEVLGEAVHRLGPRRLRALRARIGGVHQHLWLVPRATAFQNVSAGRLGHRTLLGALGALASRREAERVAAVLAQVGLDGRLHERVDRLSGGEQQRVAIARALFQDPELLVADEPIASMDPTRAAELAALLAQVFAGRTVLVSTHRIEPFLPHVTRVVGLRSGAIAFDLPAGEVGLDHLGRLYEAPSAARATSPRTLPVAAREALAGEAAISASTTPGEHLLPRALRAFVAAHPGVRIALTVKDSAGVASDVREGRADVGFLGARLPDTALHFEDFAEDEIVLVAAPAAPGIPPGPLAPEAVARLPRVEREEGSGTRRVVAEHFENLGAPLDPAAIVAEVGSLAALRTAVCAGVAAAFVSRAAVQDDLDAGRLRAIPVEGVRIPRRFYVAWRADRPPHAAARRFVELARGRGRG